MTRSTLIVGLLALALVSGACNNDDSTTGQTPTSPTSPSAPATPPADVVFTAQLAASNEVPPITNADAIHLAREGVATGLISIPNRYMHSPNEMVSLTDVDYAAALIAEVCRGVDERTDFTAR